MKTVKRNYGVLLLLAVIFACPGMAALFFYNHPQWLSANAINKGKLINPPQLLTNLKGKPKWRLILWNPGQCDVACLEQVEKLARIRLALGRRLYEVEEWLLINNQEAALSKKLRQRLKQEDIHVLLLSNEQRAKQGLLGNKSQVFIANPDDYLVLAYELDAKPVDIFNDIGQLLRAANKKSG